MSDAPFIEANLLGLLGPDFAAEGGLVARLEDLGAMMPSSDVIGTLQIRDARHLQSQARTDASFSEALFSEDLFFEDLFFEEHGFVLLPHESAVQDWDIEPSMPEASQDVVRTYQPEVEELVHLRLLPGRKLELYQTTPMRRGPGTPNPFYGAGVHQDYGLLPEDYEESLEAFATPEIARWWRHRFEQDDVEGYMVIDLWRPVYSNGPLRHMPLAVCEPHSVRVDDCVPMSVLGFSPTGRPTNQQALRVHPDQRWYYYPGMTRDEVLAFKNYQFFKNDPEQEVEACFHAAFQDLSAPTDLEERQSCEHRVSVFFLKD